MTSSIDRDAQLDAVLLGGREQREIVISEYDPAWPGAAAGWLARIDRVLGPAVISSAHIGSTAVPGLAAKPILDLLLVVANLEEEDAYLPALTTLGLQLRVREPGHRMFRPATRDVHLHVLPPGSAQERDYLVLRDRLRNSAEDRAAYEAKKRQLAAREWTDMNYYSDAKTETIRTILTHAEGSAERSGDDGSVL